MSNTAGALPAHRSVANIRPLPSVTTPTSPHTPLRTTSSTFGSPSALRAEEECVVLEIGARHLRVGFAGDAVPKAVVGFGLDEQRRAGDYRQWDVDSRSAKKGYTAQESWGERQELWRPDLRDLDLGLVGDKIERALREAYTKYLLIDSRPRRMVLALPPACPLPILSIILDTLFNNFQPPNVSLMSAPVLATVSAGLRSALVVDIGWAETMVTSVYEYREVQCRRTVRASKSLGEEFFKLASQTSSGVQSEQPMKASRTDLPSVEECEEIIERVAWCKADTKTVAQERSRELTPVAEEDEMRASMSTLQVTTNSQGDSTLSIPLTSTKPPRTMNLSLDEISSVCERALLGTDQAIHELDDEELPLHHLIYQALLKLPIDIRSICMSRIIFIGGASNIPGLRSRLLQELANLIDTRRWDPVRGSAYQKFLNQQRSSRARLNTPGPTEIPTPALSNNNHQTSSEINTATATATATAAHAAQETDPITTQLEREASKRSYPIEAGDLRAVESLGAWAGGSLLAQLKVPAVSVVDREQWLLHGAAGASRGVTENVGAAGSRNSGGGIAGLKTGGGGERNSWTLGLWG